MYSPVINYTEITGETGPMYSPVINYTEITGETGQGTLL